MACHTLDKVEITLRRAAKPAAKRARYPLKPRERGIAPDGEEKNNSKEGSGNVKWERTRRWGKISRPFSKLRPIQLKLTKPRKCV